MKIYALMETGQGEIIGVGPFKDHDDASEWADTQEAANLTVRGNIRAMSRREFNDETGVS